MSKKIPTYELYIDDINIEGLTAVSLVDYPAIKQDFFYFKEEKFKNKYELSEVDEEKRQILGVALIPDKEIIRQDMFGELYYVKFTPELVEELAHNFLKESKQHLVTEQHEVPAKDIYMIESYIIESEEDKAYSKYNYSIEDVPVGSWIVKYQLENEDIIEKIKSGEIKGFSIEAFLSEKIIMNQSSIKEKLYKAFDEYKNKEELKTLLTNKVN